jgi:hypothetical protein
MLDIACFHSLGCKALRTNTRTTTSMVPSSKSDGMPVVDVKSQTEAVKGGA